MDTPPPKLDAPPPLLVPSSSAPSSPAALAATVSSVTVSNDNSSIPVPAFPPGIMDTPPPKLDAPPPLLVPSSSAPSSPAALTATVSSVTGSNDNSSIPVPAFPPGTPLEVTVTVHAAKGLAPKDLTTSSSDPYARVLVQGFGRGDGGRETDVASRASSVRNDYFFVVLGKTPVVKKTLEPDWDAAVQKEEGEEERVNCFSAEVFDVQDTLAIELWDWNFGTTDDFEGRVLLPISSLIGQVIDRKWFSLASRGLDKEVTGHVQLSIAVQPLKVTVGHGHDFHVTTYKNPTNCMTCKKLLWGLAKQGLQCGHCGYNSHKQCLENAPICRKSFSSDSAVASVLSDKDAKLVAKLRKEKKYQPYPKFCATTDTDFQEYESYAVFHNYEKGCREVCLLVLSPMRMHIVHRSGGIAGFAKDETIAHILGIRRLFCPSPNKLRLETHGNRTWDFSCPNTSAFIQGLFYNAQALGFSVPPFDISLNPDIQECADILVNVKAPASPRRLLWAFPNTRYTAWRRYTSDIPSQKSTVHSVKTGTIARGPKKSSVGDIGTGEELELPSSSFEEFDPLDFPISDPRAQAAGYWNSSLVHNFRSFALFDSTGASARSESGLLRSSKKNMVNALNLSGGAGSKTVGTSSKETTALSSQFKHLGEVFSPVDALHQTLIDLELWEKNPGVFRVHHFEPSYLIPLFRALATRPDFHSLVLHAQNHEGASSELTDLSFWAVNDTLKYATRLSSLEICGPQKSLSDETLNALVVSASCNVHLALTKLALRDCDLSKSVKGLNLHFLPNFVALEIPNCKLGDKGLRTLAKNLPKGLKQLNIAGNKISATSLLCTMLDEVVPNLTHLDASRNSLEAGPLLAQCKKLTSLREVCFAAMESDSFSSPGTIATFLAQSSCCSAVRFDGLPGANVESWISTAAVNPLFQQSGLCLSACDLVPQIELSSVKALSNAIVSAPFLTSLELAGSLAWDPAVFQELLSGIEKSAHLETLNLGRNSRLDGANRGICVMLGNFVRANSPLKRLLLRGAPKAVLGPELKHVCEALADNTHLKELDVRDNSACDDMALSLGRALRKNRSLTTVRFSGNFLTLPGYRALRGCLHKNRKLVDFDLLELDLAAETGTLRESFVTHTQLVIDGMKELQHAVHKDSDELRQNSLRKLVDARKQLRKVRYQLTSLRETAIAIAEAISRNRDIEHIRGSDDSDDDDAADATDFDKNVGNDDADDANDDAVDATRLSYWMD